MFISATFIGRELKMKKSGFGILLIISVIGLVPGLCTGNESVEQTHPHYRWIEMYWLPQTITFSFPQKNPLVLKGSGLEQHLTIGYLTYPAKETRQRADGVNIYRSEGGFDLLYAMLEFHKPLIEKKRLGVSLFAGGGIGYYFTDTPVDFGYILPAGIQIQAGRLVGDARLNYGPANPQAFTTINIGYQGNSILGAMAGPAVLLFMGFMIMNSSWSIL
jgi:hypothetical protein